VKNVEILNPSVHPFRRSELFAIEAAVLATRIEEALKKGRRETAERLFLELGEYGKKCQRIAPRTVELNMIMKIIDLLKRKVGE